VTAGLIVIMRPRPGSQLRGDEVSLNPRGLGYVILQVVGGLISIPLILFGVTQDQLRNVRAALRADNPAKDTRSR
jgi:hypothetical protein